ncbi:MAG: VWA domain-containing protein [Acidobacteriota bacterium]
MSIFPSRSRIAAGLCVLTMGALPGHAEPELRVRLRAPETADLVSGRAVLQAEVEPPSGAGLVEVRFVVDGALLAVDVEPPYQALWTDISPDRDHLLRVTAVAEDGSRAYDLVSLPRLGMVQRATVMAYPASFVLLDVTFLGSDGRPVVDVGPEEVRLLEDGKRREVELLEPDDRPLAAELLLDASHSTRPYWEPMARAAELFARTLRPDDRAAVEAFHDESFEIAPLGSPPEAMAAALERFVDWGGGTRLYDALSHAALYTLGSGTTERRALIVLTDGVDQGSRLEAADAREFLLRAGLELHAILFEARTTIWPGVYEKNPEGKEARRVLGRMARATGGATYDPDVLPMEEIFLRIGERLRAQYLLGFTSEGREAPGEPRTIQVKLRRPGSHRAEVRESHFGTEDLGGFLARQLRDSTESRKIFLVGAAGASGDAVAMRALVRALGGEGELEAGVSREARLELLGRGVESIPFLLEGLEDPEIHSAAARVITDILVVLHRGGDLAGLDAAFRALGEGDAAAGRQRVERLQEEDLPAPVPALLREVLAGDPASGVR